MPVLHVSSKVAACLCHMCVVSSSLFNVPMYSYYSMYPMYSMYSGKKVYHGFLFYSPPPPPM